MPKQPNRPLPAVRDAAGVESMLDEFSIMELEDRLELTDRCNSNKQNCGCEPQEIE